MKKSAYKKISLASIALLGALSSVSPASAETYMPRSVRSYLEAARTEMDAGISCHFITVDHGHTSYNDIKDNLADKIGISEKDERLINAAELFNHAAVEVRNAFIYDRRGDEIEGKKPCALINNYKPLSKSSLEKMNEDSVFLALTALDFKAKGEKIEAEELNAYYESFTNLHETGHYLMLKEDYFETIKEARSERNDNLQTLTQSFVLENREESKADSYATLAMLHLKENEDSKTEDLLYTHAEMRRLTYVVLLKNVLNGNVRSYFKEADKLYKNGRISKKSTEELVKTVLSTTGVFLSHQTSLAMQQTLLFAEKARSKDPIEIFKSLYVASERVKEKGQEALSKEDLTNLTNKVAEGGLTALSKEEVKNISSLMGTAYAYDENDFINVFTHFVGGEKQNEKEAVQSFLQKVLKVKKINKEKSLVLPQMIEEVEFLDKVKNDKAKKNKDRKKTHLSLRITPKANL